MTKEKQELFTQMHLEAAIRGFWERMPKERRSKRALASGFRELVNEVVERFDAEGGAFESRVVSARGTSAIVPEGVNETDRSKGTSVTAAPGGLNVTDRPAGMNATHSHGYSVSVGFSTTHSEAGRGDAD